MFGEYERMFEKMRDWKGGEPDTARVNKERKWRAKDGSKKKGKNYFEALGDFSVAE